MKTDDRATRQRDEVEGDEAKVVRLSDWLAPDDELVPFGPRAHAQTAARESAEGRANPDSGAEMPAASGFWDGDTSVHTAVPGPGIFDEPGEPTTGRRRYRRPDPVWPRALPSLHWFDWGSRARERLADLVDRTSWRWAAGGLAIVALVVVVVVVAVGGSPGHRETAAQAGVGQRSHVVLGATLGETGTATSTAAVWNLRRLPPVTDAGRSIGAAAERARALRARPDHAVVASTSTSEPGAATTGAVDTTTTAAPTETTPAPTAPVETTPTPAPTGSGGGSPGGGSSSNSSSQKQSAFGASGSLGPGSSPNG